MFSFDLDAAIWLWPLVDESSHFRIVDAAFIVLAGFIWRLMVM